MSVGTSALQGVRKGCWGLGGWSHGADVLLPSEGWPTVPLLAGLDLSLRCPDGTAWLLGAHTFDQSCDLRCCSPTSLMETASKWAPSSQIANAANSVTVLTWPAGEGHPSPRGSFARAAGIAGFSLCPCECQGHPLPWAGAEPPTVGWAGGHRGKKESPATWPGTFIKWEACEGRGSLSLGDSATWQKGPHHIKCHRVSQVSCSPSRGLWPAHVCCLPHTGLAPETSPGPVFTRTDPPLHSRSVAMGLDSPLAW